MARRSFPMGTYQRTIYYSTVWVCHTKFSQSSSGGHLGCFQVFAVMNCVARSSRVHIPICKWANRAEGELSRSPIAGSKAKGTVLIRTQGWLWNSRLEVTGIEWLKPEDTLHSEEPACLKRAYLPRDYKQEPPYLRGPSLCSDCVLGRGPTASEGPSPQSHCL
ncbi:hypothetical protein mRhiFer1_010312 [Rhinolophus ferrumequinum]|uniref:Uncharacterized protein n=1 Tax=Rhinolophus ferrumequinum TaxID=59479 RepID=A0A7J7X5X1_RHIFE|nr:hypothetical protein mRhiFer1_010312 [Rhinolophus ferrumequinum]